MSDICCGVPVPTVPERPIDLTQPAYVLVDGRWVLLSEIIAGYLPPTPPAGGAVLQVKRVTFPGTSAFSTNTAQIGSTVTITPTTQTSSLLVFGSLHVQMNTQTGSTATPDLVYVGVRSESSTGVYAAINWFQRAACELEPITSQRIRQFHLHNDFTAADRRSDTNEWALAVWFQQNNGKYTNVSGETQLTLVEYEPAT